MKALRTLISTALGVKETERVCIICDDSRMETAIALKQILDGRTYIEHVKGRMSCNNLPIEVKQLLSGDSYKVIIICILREQDIWHSQERKNAKYHMGKRLASVIAPYSFLKDIEFEHDLLFMKELADFLLPKLCEGAKVRIKTMSETDVEAIIGTPFREDGNYDKAGSGGDFPSGEIGFGPREFSVGGQINYDLKVQDIGVMKEGDIVVDIERDEVKVTSGRRKKDFEERISLSPVLNLISEISFGINPSIAIYDNKSNIIEEKKAGTVHFGHGGNSAYGNRVGPHFDCVINKPTVFIDDRLIMKEGLFSTVGAERDLILKMKKYGLSLDE